MTIGVGRLVDREGVRQVWFGVAAGLGSACLALSLATGPVMVLVALCLMRGFGQGSFPLLGTMLVADRFAARRGRAMSLSAQGWTAAGVLLPLLGASPERLTQVCTDRVQQGQLLARHIPALAGGAAAQHRPWTRGARCAVRGARKVVQ